MHGDLRVSVFYEQNTGNYEKSMVKIERWMKSGY